jgi:hypothetical protein
MLKYKLNLHDIKTDNIVQLDCESIYFSEDGSFVSGITLSNVLSDGQIVYIGEENSLKYKECTVNTEKVIRQGATALLTFFDVITLEDGTKFVEFVDGNKYVFTKNGDKYIWTLDSIYNIENGKIVSPLVSDDNGNIKPCDNEVDANKILVNTLYYVNNGKMVINNIEYEVDLLSGEIIGFDYYFDNGSDYTVTGLYKMPSYVTKFTIKKDNNFNLNIDNICCSKLYKYINYNDNKYYLYRNSEGFKLSGVTYNNDFVKTVDVLSDNITEIFTAL